MARPAQLLFLLSRHVSASLGQAACVTSSRCASRDARMVQSFTHKASGQAPRHGRGRADEEQEFEDEADIEDRLQALVDEEAKKRKTVKFHILRRKMTPPGAPQRKLTWDAIEQIRYLKQEQPEEWSVQRLAEGFSVSTDDILRVLRSKFTPAPERKAQQDAKVMAELRQQALPSGGGTDRDKMRLSGSQTTALVSAGSTESAVITASERGLVLRGKESGRVASALHPIVTLPAQLTATSSTHTSDAVQSPEEGVDNSRFPEDIEEEEVEEESWDGVVFLEEDLEEFLGMKKPPPAVQVGSEFFDEEGLFLYRI